jgi:hypothetical protein
MLSVPRISDSARICGLNYLRKMTGNDDYYRQQAKEAEKQAELARHDLDREAWLRIAREWKSLVRDRPRGEGEDAKPKD